MGKEQDRDFALKAAVRALLWAQGYSTRVDVLLAYDVDPRGKTKSGKAGLTDLDVLALRLDPGFRMHWAVADCRTSSGQVPERLFWLAGVGQFFGADSLLLVRSQTLPEHAPPLARSLGISLVGPEDLKILENTFLRSSEHFTSPVWAEFFSVDLLGEVLNQLSRLPATLQPVERYRDSQYWMDEPHIRLQRVIAVLQLLAKDGASSPAYQLVFADFVWLFIIALWKAAEVLAASGLSRIERGLQVYLSGNESGMANLARMQRAFEAFARRANVNTPLPLLPPYYKDLGEVLVRCVRRPEAMARMARRAEWLVVGQIVGGLGPPPWASGDDEVMAEKLLGDVAHFLVRASGLGEAFLEGYVYHLQAPRRAAGESGKPTPIDKARREPRPEDSPATPKTIPVESSGTQQPLGLFDKQDSVDSAGRDQVAPARVDEHEPEP